LTALGATSASVTTAHAAAGVKKLSDGSVEVTVASIKSLAKVGGIALIGEVNGVPVRLFVQELRNMPHWIYGAPMLALL